MIKMWPSPQQRTVGGLALKFPRRSTLLKIIFALVLLVTGLVGTAFYLTSHYGAQTSALSDHLFGHEWTLKFERVNFSVKDPINRLKYRAFGGSGNPFVTDTEQVKLSYVEDDGVASWEGIIELPKPVIIPPKPAPLTLPEVAVLRSDLKPGEGVWVADGLPHSGSDDMLMARTFVRPDTSRDAVVGVLLLDKRRIRLHIAPSGMVPEADRPNLLAAWNGGFQLAHASWGMFVDGKTYKPLIVGKASVALTQGGSIQMGTWGVDLGLTDDKVAVRQNGELLVSGCQINTKTNNADPNIWGRVSDNDTVSFITTRSAIGLTANGDLLVAAGTNLNAATLAKALWAAGACSAMQLDINTAWVIVSLFFPKEDGGVTAQKFMSSMNPSANRFFSRQNPDRDFMYVTWDETKFVP